MEQFNIMKQFYVMVRKILKMIYDLKQFYDRVSTYLKTTPTKIDTGEEEKVKVAELGHLPPVVDCR